VVFWLWLFWAAAAGNQGDHRRQRQRVLVFRQLG
jgi:hypothetical protein